MPLIPWLKMKKEQIRNKKLGKGSRDSENNKKSHAYSREARKHNTEEENSLLDIAQKRFEIAKEGKCDHKGRPLHDKWRDFDRFYRSDQWLQDVPDHKSTPVLNFTFSLIESVVPRITDNNPRILVLPRKDPLNNGLAKMLSQGQEYLWTVNNMKQKLIEATRMTLKYGTSIFKTVWDPDASYGAGDISYTVVHPMNFFNDPRAYEIDQMEYCFTSVPTAVEFIIRRWPNKGHLVMPDNDWTETEAIEGADQPSQEDVATLKEYWFFDEHGDLCVMYYVGHLVLQVIGGKYDENNVGNEATLFPNEPVFRHNKFPFAKFEDYPTDKEFWATGEIEIVQLIQQLINNFEAQVIDNTRLMANAQWIVSKTNSGLREEDAWLFDDRPGNVIFTHAGGVSRVPGAPLPPHITNHMERLIFAMEQILGIHDVVQGRRPVGVRAASAIIALQEAGNVRVRQKARNLEYCLERLANLSNWLMLEFYDQTRQVRVLGAAPPVTLNIREVLEQQLVRQAAGAGIDIPAGLSPEHVTADLMSQIHQQVRYPEFDVEVKVGPSVPQSQALLYEMSKEFYQLGLVDRRAVLEITNFPGWEEILARMEGQVSVGKGERVGERGVIGQGAHVSPQPMPSMSPVPPV